MRKYSPEWEDMFASDDERRRRPSNAIRVYSLYVHCVVLDTAHYFALSWQAVSYPRYLYFNVMFCIVSTSICTRYAYETCTRLFDSKLFCINICWLWIKEYEHIFEIISRIFWNYTKILWFLQLKVKYNLFFRNYSDIIQK